MALKELRTLAAAAASSVELQCMIARYRYRYTNMCIYIHVDISMSVRLHSSACLHSCAINGSHVTPFRCASGECQKSWRPSDGIDKLAGTRANALGRFRPFVSSPTVIIIFCLWHLRASFMNTLAEASVNLQPTSAADNYPFKQGSSSSRH